MKSIRTIFFYTYQLPSPRDINSGTFNLSRIKSLLQNNFKVVVLNPICITPPLKFKYHKVNLFKIFYHFVRNLTNKPFPINSVTIIPVKWFKFPILQAYMQSLFVRRKFKNVIKKFNPDLILTSGINNDTLSLKFLLKNNKIPIYSIAEGSDMYLINLKRKDCISDIINQLKINVLAVSNDLKIFIDNNYNINKCLTLKNGFNNQLFPFYEKEYTLHKFQLITVGRLEHVKGHDILIKALSKMDNFINLIILGEGIKFAEYTQLVRNHNIEDRVVFLGKKSNEEVYKYLFKSDLFVLPSRSESFGIAALEAMSVGLPVVSSNVGGMKELIIEGFNGLFFNNEDEKDLIQKINEARFIKWNRKKISDYVNQNYSWNKWVDDFMSILKTN